MSFRVFLKNRADDDKLDGDFAAHHKELFSEEFCVRCRNCCRECDVLLTDDDAAAI